MRVGGLTFYPVIIIKKKSKPLDTDLWLPLDAKIKS